MLNFIKTHCLIGDFVEGTLVHFISRHAITVEVDRISANLRADSMFFSSSALNSMPLSKDANDNVEINVFYLGTGMSKIRNGSNFFNQN